MARVLTIAAELLLVITERTLDGGCRVQAGTSQRILEALRANPTWWPSWDEVPLTRQAWLQDELP